MLLIFFAVCYACDWCFDHNRPGLAVLIGGMFAAFYLIDRWMDIPEDE